ncbi:MAG TPA: hypothetical protein VGD41_13635, partial [Pyrinomonadaceae bacterium]
VDHRSFGSGVSHVEDPKRQILMGADRLNCDSPGFLHRGPDKDEFVHTSSLSGARLSHFPFADFALFSMAVGFSEGGNSPALWGFCLDSNWKDKELLRED